MASATHLMEEQIRDFRDAFLSFDTRGDGTVKLKEIGTVLKACGENPTSSELNEIINEYMAEDLLTFMKNDEDTVSHYRN
ncbi:calmodulin-like [Glandiceps talaboti]